MDADRQRHLLVTLLGLCHVPNHVIISFEPGKSRDCQALEIPKPDPSRLECIKFDKT